MHQFALLQSWEGIESAEKKIEFNYSPRGGDGGMMVGGGMKLGVQTVLTDEITPPGKWKPHYLICSDALIIGS